MSETQLARRSQGIGEGRRPGEAMAKTMILRRRYKRSKPAANSSEISSLTKIPSHKVLWYIMAMKRFGKVAEAGQAGDYFRYGLKEASS
jgi:hypothetical protein